MEAVAAILGSISNVQRDYNNNLEIGGFLLTMYDAKTRLSEEVANEIRSVFKEKLFHSYPAQRINSRIKCKRNANNPLSTNKCRRTRIYELSSRGYRQ